MALHDISKNHDARLNPQPNTNDAQQQRMAHNTASPTFRTEGGKKTGRMVFKNGLILGYDAENRVSSVFGYIPALADFPVLIIARTGFDVYKDILGLDRPTV